MYPFIGNFVLPDRESGKSLASLPRQGWLGEGSVPTQESSGSPRLENILQQIETFFQSPPHPPLLLLDHPAISFSNPASLSVPGAVLMCVPKYWLPSVWLGGQQPVLGQDSAQKVPLQPGLGAPTWQFCHGLPWSCPCIIHSGYSGGLEVPRWTDFEELSVMVRKGYLVTWSLERCSYSWYKVNRLMLQLFEGFGKQALCIEKMKLFSDFLWM